MWALASAASKPRAACLPAWPHFPGRKGHACIAPSYIHHLGYSYKPCIHYNPLSSSHKKYLCQVETLGGFGRVPEAWEGEVACSRSNGCLVTTGAEQPVALKLTHLLIVALCAELFSYPSEEIGVLVINKPGRCLSQPCRRP